MKKYFAIFAAVAILGMLAIYFVPEKTITKATTTSVTTAAPATDATSTQSTASTATSTATSATTSATSSSTANSNYKDGSYNGSSAATPYGDVQVAIVVSGGKITNVTFLALPNDDNHSARISDQVSPTLKAQTLSAQSASIDGVSGATYTSEGYVQSLQSAIDAAKV